MLTVFFGGGRVIRSSNLTRRALRAALVLVCLAPIGASRPQQASRFAQFVDHYLDDFARRHPSIAAGNGLSPDQTRWMEAYYADAEMVARLIADGDARRDAKGGDRADGQDQGHNGEQGQAA